MKKLVLKPTARYADDELPHDFDFPDGDGEDCKRIVEICKEQGYEIDLLTAYNAWIEHSMDWDAQWLIVDKPEHVIQHVLEFCDIVE